MTNWAEINQRLALESARTLNLVERDNQLRERDNRIRAAQISQRMRELSRSDSAERDVELSDRERRREQLRRDAQRCAEHQRRYDDSFSKLGRRAPTPVADALPRDYRRELFGIGQTMLPSSHELNTIDPQSLDGSVIVPFEKQLLEALAAEAEMPSQENMPDSIYDAGSERVRIDPTTGLRTREFYAKTSFIKDYSRPGRLARIADPRSLSGQRQLAGALWR